MSDIDPILIAGAGIGGLAAGIALCERGWSVRIFERSERLQSIGAGIQLGPNAVRVLQALGVAPFLTPHVMVPNDLIVTDGQSGQHLTRILLGEEVEARFGAPYWTLHRADLQSALTQRLKQFPKCELLLGVSLKDFEVSFHGVTVETDFGKPVRGAGLVIADGLWSQGRTVIAPHAILRFCGKTAARALIPMADVPCQMAVSQINLWLLPNAHVVAYPIRGGKELNLVVILDDDWREERWDGGTDRAIINKRLDAADAYLRELTAIPEKWTKWPLYELAPLSRWSERTATLLGDAAHPVLPFLAQGAALALEDANALANALVIRTGKVTEAWQFYEAQRRKRASKLQDASRRNGTIYHMSGLSRVVRNFLMRHLKAQHLMGRYNWIYRHSA